MFISNNRFFKDTMKCWNKYCDREAKDNGVMCKACSYIRHDGYVKGFNKAKNTYNVNDITYLIKQLKGEIK